MKKSLLSKEQLAHCIDLQTPGLAALSFFNLSFNGIGIATNSVKSSFLNFQVDEDLKLSVEILYSFFPQLLFSDLAILIAAKNVFDTEELLKKYQIPNTKKIHSLLSESLSWDKAITRWCFDKKIRPQELLILSSLTAEERQKLLRTVSLSELSKSQAMQTLEWLSDLILLKIQIPEDIYSSLNEASFEKIKEMRYPKSFLKHPLQSAKINWGFIQGQFMRRQDKAGFQLQVFVSNPEELSKVIQQLQKNHEDWVAQ